MELSLGPAQGRRFAQGHAQRRSRAHWWFQQMRQVVESAMDWSPAPLARPEQMILLNEARQPARPQPQPVVRANSEERQICA